MIVSIIVGYLAGRLIETFYATPYVRYILAGAILIHLGGLIYFKYADFILANVNGLTGSQFPMLKIALPIGISFYTFQSISYVIDVYREIDEEIDEDDISLDQFNDDIEQWVIDELRKQGYATARQILGTSREELVDKTDLEEGTIDEIIRILSAEFEK